MAFSVVMPALEMAQETGKLIAWRKREGDRVTKGEPLLEIETDKAVMEVEAPADGILAGITGSVGADIPVGQTIAWIVAPGEAPPAEKASAISAAPAARGKTESHATPVAAGALQPAAATGGRVSPKARRLAKELGVDIASLRGSGPLFLTSSSYAKSKLLRSTTIAKDCLPRSSGRITSASRIPICWSS